MKKKVWWACNICLLQRILIWKNPKCIKYPTMHHFVAEMCVRFCNKIVHHGVKDWCIVVFVPWELCSSPNWECTILWAWALFQNKDSLFKYRDSHYKDQSWDHLIFTMGIPILVRWPLGQPWCLLWIWNMISSILAIIASCNQQNCVQIKQIWQNQQLLNVLEGNKAMYTYKLN